MHRMLCSLLAGLLLLGAAPARSLASVSPDYLTAMHWRMIGPFRGGRALAVTGVPGHPNRYYFGSVDGGVWESTDAGRTWNPIFDGQDVASIGAIAVAPSAPDTLYVGTGEADMRSDIAYGNGVYKSTDGGKTWTHEGLTDTQQIGAIVVDPTNPNVVYVAALGHAYGPNAERGVFKSVDGGMTWSKVLYKNPNTGAIALAMDPSNPNVLYAALWQTRRPPWNVYPPSNGPGSGLYKSTDAGKTWQHLTAGLPAHVGRIGVAIAGTQPQRIYAVVDSDAQHGGIYVSNDGGAHWARSDADWRLWQRGWYFGGITADPKNPNEVYVMNTATYRSIDGGKTFDAIRGAPGGDDYHTLWIAPDDPNHMILASDQGVVVSVNDAKTWSSWYNQPTGQFYHVAVDNRFPFFAYGAQQDSGAAMAPSATKYATISQQDFRPIDVGGENGELAPDPHHPGLVYGGTVTKELVATGWEQNIDPTLAYPRHVWRGTWTLPLVFSPIDGRTLYFGRQRIFRSTDAGNTWQIVSPDLARPVMAPPSNLDAPTAADNDGLARHGVVYAIAPSPLRRNLIWAGTDDGYVWITRDGAKHWTNVTPPALTPWSKIAAIEASHFNPRTAYIAVDRHRLNDYRPYIYRTTDDGRTWTRIDRGIPDGAFVNVVREDPHVRGLLYAGTEHGVDVSFDDGAHWQSLRLNLPVTSVRDIALRDDAMVIATHGRAFWMLDDIAPLRQMRAAVAAGGTYLFAPALSYRVRPGNEEGTPLPLDEPQAQNPTPGVAIDYYLPDVPRTPVVLAVLTPKGTLLRRWSSAQKPQVPNPNAVDIAPQWLTTPPLPAATAGAHQFVWGFHAKNANGPLVPPGTYLVRLSVNGRTYTQHATVLRDPRVPATNADLRAQYALATAIDARIAAVHAARARALALLKTLKSAAARTELRRAVIGIRIAGNPDDSVGAPAHDFASLRFLAGAYANLEAAVESADAAPTADMRVAYRKLNTIEARALATLARLSP